MPSLATMALHPKRRRVQSERVEFDGCTTCTPSDCFNWVPWCLLQACTLWMSVASPSEVEQAAFVSMFAPCWETTTMSTCFSGCGSPECAAHMITEYLRHLLPGTINSGLCCLWACENDLHNRDELIRSPNSP